MAKRKPMAKVHYNPDNDSFELWLKSSDDEEWGFSRSTKCRALNADQEPEFIHFSFLREVMLCIKLGYDVFEA